MSILDLETLLEPIADGAPAGENLEDFSFDPEYQEFERAAAGTPERVMGDNEVAAEPPNWAEVQSKAIELLGRAKSLSVAVSLSQALMHKQGLPGLAESLELIARMLDQYWDTVHPLLDAEDDDDPTERLNALSQLAGANAVTALRETDVINLGPMGKFTVRDYLWAAGKQSPPASWSEPLMELAVMSAMMADCELEQLQAAAQAIDTSMQQLVQIEATVAEHVGATYPFGLDPLAEMLQVVQPFVAEALARRGVVAVGMEGVAAEAAVQATGEINSRDDVIRVLDRACEYFNRNEPSSPVPLLLQRAKRLIAQDFMSILKDIAPDALSQVQNVSGTQDD